jgi:hypothetical protein
MDNRSLTPSSREADALRARVAELEAENDSLRTWAIMAAPLVHRTLHEGHSVESRMNCHHPLCVAITALHIPYPNIAPQPPQEPETYPGPADDEIVYPTTGTGSPLKEVKPETPELSEYAQKPSGLQGLK